MRKDFDYLLRNTYFLPWNPDSPEFDHDAALDFCVENGFGHFMLNETRWCKSAGWYESCMPGGHSDLKRLVTKAHERGLIFTLHGRVVEIYHDDPFYLQPRPEGLVQIENHCFIDPESDFQQQVSARFIAVADMINADGLYIDGGGITSTIEDTEEKFAALATQHRSVIEQLTRPMLLQAAHTTSYKDEVGNISTGEFYDYWCWSGQLDHYSNVRLLGYDTYTRDMWNNEYIKRAKEALKLGYPSHIGWIDFGHGLIRDGKPIEDQNPDSMTKLCTFAKEHNIPIVLEATLEEIDSHPQKDELLQIIRAMGDK